MASFTYVREVAAPPEIVFDVLTDHRRYPEITRLRRAELEREGEPAPNGVGAIRVLSAVPVGPPMREEVLAYERPRRFSYTVLSGLPFRDHVGTVELEPGGGGTKITYAVRTTPTVPLAGGAVIFGLKQAIKSLLGGVAKESERRAAANA
ncbi:MAG TPA: SRPBCC family protein [Solirubrobacterales bacterium]|nr:SRPBCC family protein [Solirubrobacterales bacterium]